MAHGLLCSPPSVAPCREPPQPSTARCQRVRGAGDLLRHYPRRYAQHGDLAFGRGGVRSGRGDGRRHRHEHAARRDLSGLAPVLDVTRDYRWGCTEETIGEDPYLVGVIGSAYGHGPRPPLAGPWPGTPCLESNGVLRRRLRNRSGRDPHDLAPSDAYAGLGESQLPTARPARDDTHERGAASSCLARNRRTASTSTGTAPGRRRRCGQETSRGLTPACSRTIELPVNACRRDRTEAAIERSPSCRGRYAYRAAPGGVQGLTTVADPASSRFT
jgi:hypothetical protein